MLQKPEGRGLSEVRASI